MLPNRGRIELSVKNPQAIAPKMIQKGYITRLYSLLSRSFIYKHAPVFHASQPATAARVNLLPRTARKAFAAAFQEPAFR